jgi:hypothetical protein
MLLYRAYRLWRHPVRIISLVLIVLGWVVILVGAFGSGINFTIGSLNPILTGIVLVLGGLSLGRFG